MADPTLPGPWAPDEAPGPTCNLGGPRVEELDADEDANAATLALVAAGVEGDGLAQRVEALIIERDALGACNDRLRAELSASEHARAGLAARVRELETLVALYARGGAQA